MANEMRQLTVADLEAAKDWHTSESADLRHHEKSHKMHSIAATCIGIVEEMMKCVKPRRGECSRYCSSSICYGADTTFDLQDDTGWDVGQNFLEREDVEHLASLHNLWLKVVAAFGGEEEKGGV